MRIAVSLTLGLFIVGWNAEAQPTITKAKAEHCMAELKRDGNSVQLRLKFGETPWRELANSPSPAAPNWPMKQGEFPDSPQLWKIPRGTPLFHWGDDEETKTLWPKQGTVTGEQLKRRLTYTQNLAGGGIYVSRSVEDSSGYGEHLVVFTPDHDLLVAAFPEKFYCPNELWSKLGIEGIWYTPNWVDLIKDSAVSHLHGGDASDVCRFLAQPKGMHIYQNNTNPMNENSHFLAAVFQIDQHFPLGVCPGALGVGDTINRLFRGQSLDAQSLKVLQDALELYHRWVGSHEQRRTPLWDALARMMPKQTSLIKFLEESKESPAGGGHN